MVRQGGLHHGPSFLIVSDASIQIYLLKQKKQPPILRIDGCVCLIRLLAAAYENKSLITPPFRTKVIGRPVLVSYSMAGSIPRL